MRAPDPGPDPGPAILFYTNFSTRADMAYARKKRRSSPKRSTAKRSPRRATSRPAGKLTAIHIYVTGARSTQVRSSTKRSPRRATRRRR